MDTLRIILVIFGILLVAGIWLTDRLNRRKPKTPRRNAIDPGILPPADESFTTVEEPLPDEWVGKAVSISARRHQPLADEQLNDLKGMNGTPAATEATVPDSSHHSVPEALPETVIVLTVMAREEKYFSGPLLLKVLQEAGLDHGEMGLFHYHLAGKDEPLFSVANILEPGRFELSEIATLQTPGLALFMRLPAMVPGEQALQILLQKSRQIAAQLSGSLCDEQRQSLGEEKLAELEQKAGRYTAS